MIINIFIFDIVGVFVVIGNADKAIATSENGEIIS